VAEQNGGERDWGDEGKMRMRKCAKCILLTDAIFEEITGFLVRNKLIIIVLCFPMPIGLQRRKRAAASVTAMEHR